ncbi:MAG TPA: toll/interleukin-1 receptor domain-containing protein [Longimicrobium sp.]
MPARVEFRLGSIFDEPCDLLVIPSAGGMVTPEIQMEIREAGLPFSDVNTNGLSVIKLLNARWKAVAYAAGVSGQTSGPLSVEAIARELGRQATWQGYRTISAPLLGADSGDTAPDVAAGALMRGFMSNAPDGALLVVSIRNAETLAALTSEFPHAVGRHIQSPLDASMGQGRRAGEGFMEWLERRTTVDATERPPPAAPAATASQREGVFISYSHVDAEWLERLQKHLKPLQREGIEVWDDTRLKAGQQWREEIREALAKTKVAILLISADFLASDFIVTNELPPLLEAAEKDGATILPVIISPCRFTRMESLSRFQAVNDPEKPLIQMGRANREKVLDKVAHAVEDALKR